MPQLDQLPREILQTISDHLDPLSVGRLGQTSRRINGALQLPLVRAAKQYALPDEAEYKQRIKFKEDGKGVRSRKRTHRLPPQPLVQAIRQHQLSKVRNYLEAGVDPNAYDLDGNRMLSLAVRVKDEPIVDLLLEHGANPSLNDVCVPYTSPVMSATLRGDEMVKKLIRIGADCTHAKVIQALASRCGLDVIKLAIDHGADFRQISLGGSMMHHVAANMGRMHSDGRTLYYQAATTIKHLDVLMFLIEKYPERLSPQTGKHALQLAINHGSAEFVETLITAGISIAGDTALHAALAGRYSLGIIKAAVDRGADFGLTSRDGRTMIHEAATNINHPDVLGFLIEKYPELLSSQTTSGKTALWSAIYQGTAELAKTLITAGIDMNLRDHTGKTALHAALEFTDLAVHEKKECDGQETAERCVSIATALLEHGIQVGIADQWGLTELHHAVQGNKDHWSRKRRPSVVRLLLSKIAVDINATNYSGSTPLHLAAKAGWLQVVRILVKKGNADVNARDVWGKTPADVALAERFPEVVRYLLRRSAN